MQLTSNPIPTQEGLHWQRWLSYGALLWSLVYGSLGLYWTFGGAGFPFGSDHDPTAPFSILANVQTENAAPVIAALGLLSAIVALLMLQVWGQSLARVVLLTFAWTLAVVLCLVIPDYRVLAAVAYAPIFLVGAPFGWPPVSFLVAIPWPVINQFICIIGGLLWAGAAVIYGRRSGSACVNCGRTEERSAHWTTPASARRWGKWAVYVAVIIPLLYAITRWAWALGIPLGISKEFLREGQETGLWWAGAGLATLGVGGSLLTLGLMQRWGEIFPRWIPFLSGKRVPIPLAVIPASLVAVLVTAAGLMFVRFTLIASRDEFSNFFNAENWAALAPELLWPLWGFALGAATLAYYYRRRGRCRYCGRH